MTNAIESAAVETVKAAAGLVTHWQALAFGGMALVAGLGAGALYFYDKGFTSASVKYERELAAANAEVKAAHAEAQTKADTTAAQANADAQDRFDAIGQDIAAIKARMGKPTTYAKPLAADCQFDAERIKAANEALK